MPKIVGDNDLELFRRHLPKCPDRLKGRRYNCDFGCPIWCDGKRNGKRYRRSLGTDWERALRKTKQLEKKPDEPLEALEEVTLAQAQKRYELDCRSRNCAESTVLSYVQCIDTLRRYAEPGVLNVAEVTFGVLEKFRRWMAGEEYAPTTTRMVLKNLKSFFTFCRNEGWIEEHPSVGQKPVYVTPAPPSPLTSDEVRRLREACLTFPPLEWILKNPERARRLSKGRVPRPACSRERAVAFLLVMLYTGIRISDATMLSRSSVDLETGRMIIVPRKSKRRGRALSLQLQPEVVEALQALPPGEGSPGYFFLQSRAVRVVHAIENNRAMIRKVFKIAGIEGHTPHHFRDTFAKAFLMSGGSMRDLQIALGHSSIMITERHYAGFDESYQRLVDEGVARISYE